MYMIDCTIWLVPMTPMDKVCISAFSIISSYVTLALIKSSKSSPENGHPNVGNSFGLWHIFKILDRQSLFFLVQWFNKFTRSNSCSWFRPGARFVNCFCDLITLASAFKPDNNIMFGLRTNTLTVLDNFTFQLQMSHEYQQQQQEKPQLQLQWLSHNGTLCPCSSSFNCHVFCFCDSGGFLLDYQDYYENSHKKMRVGKMIKLVCSQSQQWQKGNI